ncbi:glycerol dehydrogenase [Burkholderia sp. Ac-20365]|uniref:glycerol dehydrogenase n=1 Tax=Burkholderia sp. Ac-20365 TaxID=2703897 RepID=UPI00197C153B|nr:glycerol dehydrogenase [Burkholderia sp. Ac-20365]MBN3767848.1 glycerol dehydrogenase [Burkholderia sp. Ac-20365]
MTRAYAGPGKYIQRAGEISRLSQHLGSLGHNVLVVIDAFLFDRLKGALKSDLEGAGLSVHLEKFGGECTLAEIARVTEVARRQDSRILVGVGGGKTADTVKIAAFEVDARTVIVPTIASTDAPCSAVAVRYTADGIYEGSARLPRNPDLVIVDTEIVASAPVRFLVAGMGDALSTWFEARSNLESRTKNYVAGGFPPTTAGIAIARACHDVLMRDGLKAKQAVEAGLCTTAVENIIEANTLLSSIGFENCGCSAAHGIHDGLTVLSETHGMLHGEKVAFGTLCLLMLENRPLQEIEEMIRFCEQVGLPTTLAHLGLEGNLRQNANRIAEASLADGESTYACPVDVSTRLVSDSILALDAFARTITANA